MEKPKQKVVTFNDNTLRCMNDSIKTNINNGYRLVSDKTKIDSFLFEKFVSGYIIFEK